MGELLKVMPTADWDFQSPTSIRRYDISPVYDNAYVS
tara:strand:- start:97 stop:207 length:111 start_codon:yes stop_codon:yes gene_type:complete